MSAGLFGKLPAKRDFVVANAPRRFLETWEPWLQSSVATSRQAIGADWVENYNRAPIWRYWLGADFCGEPLIGAFMASVDGVGRAFPLTIFAFGDEDGLAPPEIDSNGAWCEDAEALLLTALDAGVTFESITEGLVALSPPAKYNSNGSPFGCRTLKDGGTLVETVGADLSAALLAARRFDHRSAFASQSFWWTIGGEGFAPCALCYAGLPPPARFSDFLTGAFAELSPASSGEST